MTKESPTEIKSFLKGTLIKVDDDGAIGPETDNYLCFDCPCCAAKIKIGMDYEPNSHRLTLSGVKEDKD